ncbi:MAG: hypothetical protein P4L16_07300 [Chlamydiales bacterium]|nr:hypothetical protein [Chlamydiales bacterium]
MHALILVKKPNPANFFWSNLIKRNNFINMPVEEVIDKYNGFEGELVAFYLIPRNLMDAQFIINECIELKNLDDCSMLHIISEEDQMPISLQNQALKVGYDVGICDPDGIYSSIHNEILFGILPELIVYKDSLNAHLLFSDKTMAEKYVNLHDELSAQGKDVEDYMPMTIYEIWKHLE